MGRGWGDFRPPWRGKMLPLRSHICPREARRVPSWCSHPLPSLHPRSFSRSSNRHRLLCRIQLQSRHGLTLSHSFRWIRPEEMINKEGFRLLIYVLHFPTTFSGNKKPSYAILPNRIIGMPCYCLQWQQPRVDSPPPSAMPSRRFQEHLHNHQSQPPLHFSAQTQITEELEMNTHLFTTHKHRSHVYAYVSVIWRTRYWPCTDRICYL